MKDEHEWLLRNGEMRPEHASAVLEKVVTFHAIADKIASVEHRSIVKSDLDDLISNLQAYASEAKVAVENAGATESLTS